MVTNNLTAMGIKTDYREVNLEKRKQFQPFHGVWQRVAKISYSKHSFYIRNVVKLVSFSSKGWMHINNALEE